jgi:exopolysaccharide biosynthesis polyprenyl glycosylphosphotransferase
MAVPDGVPELESLERDSDRLFEPELLRPKWLRYPVGRYLLVGDLLAFVLAGIPDRPRTGGAILIAALLLVGFGLAGLYRSRLSLSLLDDLPYIGAAVFVCLVTELAVGDVAPELLRERSPTREMAVLLLLLLVWRGLAYVAVRRARCGGRVRHTALMLGGGQVAIQLTNTLLARREYGLDVVGFIDPHPRFDLPGDPPAPVLGGYADLADLIEDFAVRVVIVAFGTMRESDLVGVLRTCDRLSCEIFFVPRLFELHATTRDMDEVWGLPLVRVRRAPFRSYRWTAKRFVDVLFAGAALLLLSPLLAVCALAVRLETGPGFLFRQERVGLDGRPFDLLKFRSLKPVTETESATRWNIAHDNRLGRVGRFLRRTSLDELPQLWNIVRGQMSLVGPRPERPHFVDEFNAYVPRYTSRHRVPSGLTGWAQIHGLRGDTSIQDRASFDNYYIENWSLWSDFKIMVRTIGQVLRRGGS